jgi:streptomycin 6-kinase
LEFIESVWRDLGKPCTEGTQELALYFATEKGAAFDPNNSVLVHGDAHSHNTLGSFDKKGGYKFVDPDGLFAEPAYDLGISMRGWNDELLVGDAITRWDRPVAELSRRSPALMSEPSGSGDSWSVCQPAS